MDTLAMHRTLTEAGIPDGQADAIIKVMQGGVATKHDLEFMETRVQTRFATLDAKVDKLDNKVNLILVTIVLGVVAPAVVRFAFG